MEIKTGFRRSKGFTLSEVLVTVSTFLLLSLTILGILITGLRYMSRLETDIDAQNKVMDSIEVITDELRQGIPNSSSAGYTSITPVVSSTAILMPNNNQKTSNELIFNVPNYDGAGSGSQWNPALGITILSNPAYFKKIRYYVENSRTLCREVTTYSSSGAADASSKQELAQISNPDGYIKLDLTWLKSDLVEVKVTCNEGYRDFVGTEKAYLLVRN